MNQWLDFTSYPIGSLLERPAPERTSYMEKIGQLPSPLQDILYSWQTGAYLRGLTKTHNLPLEQATSLAFIVTQISLGEKTLAQLASMLSTQLRVANDKAQQIAKEIERDLFAPLMLELNNYLLQKKKTAASPPNVARGVQNVIDLKNQPRPPVPPPIPPARSNL